MDITLKKISWNPKLSDDSNAFTADIYINGKKAGTAKNSGQGGDTDVNIFDSGLRLEAEKWAKSLPDVVYAGMSLKMNLEFYIDLEVEKYLLRKQAKVH